MKAISLWQPWATLIAVGEKRVETRGWETRYRGRLAIHAAKKWTRDLSDLCLTEPFAGVLSAMRPNRGGAFYLEDILDEILPRGCIVATCRIVACLPTPREWPDFGATFTLVDPRRLPTADPMAYTITPTEGAFGDYSPGRWAWVLDDISPLAKPIPYSGKQGLFEIPDDLVEGVGA